MPSLRRSFRLQLPVELWAAVAAAARAEQVSPEAVIQRALRADLARANAREPKRRGRSRSR